MPESQKRKDGRQKKLSNEEVSKLSEKRGRGQPPKEIDWEKVEELLICGCSGVEIAGYLGISDQALYDGCLRVHKIIFSHYAQRFAVKGDSILRATQYEKAIKEKDNTLLIWLGKTRLKQSETAEITKVTEDYEKKINILLNQLAQMQNFLTSQSSLLNIANNSNINEHMSE